MANKVTLTSAPLVDENADEKTHTHQQHGTERRLYAGVSGCRTVNEKPFYVDRDFHAPSSPPPGARKKHKSRLHFDQKPSREEGNMTRVIKRVGGSCAQRTAAARWPD